MLNPAQNRRALPRRIVFAALLAAALGVGALAALKPEARAQETAGLTAPLKFAGITDGRGPGSGWWDVSGKSLPTPVFNTGNAYQLTKVPLQPEQRGMIFAFRLPAATQGATVHYEVPDGLSYSSLGSWPGKIQAWGQTTEAKLNSERYGVRAIGVAFLPTIQKTCLRVGVASGSWQTVAFESINPQALGSVSDLGLGSVSGSGSISGSGNNFLLGPPSDKFLLSPPAETKSGLVVTITANTADDVRVIASDKQGQQILPAHIHDSRETVVIGNKSSGSLDQITAQFTLSPSQVGAIFIQTRPFIWAEYKDVTLYPSQH